MQEGDQSSRWVFKTDKSGSDDHGQDHPASMSMMSGGEEVTWTASEYVSHEKNTNWFALAFLVGLAVAAVIYVITRTWVTVATTIVLLFAVMVYANKKPRSLEYKVSHGGVTVGKRFYPFENFRSLSVVDDPESLSVVLMPAKRFMLPLTLYYQEKDEERILNIIANYLPVEEYNPDPVERFSKRIRF